MQAEDAVEDGGRGKDSYHPATRDAYHQQKHSISRHTFARQSATGAAPDAAPLPGADVDSSGSRGQHIQPDVAREETSTSFSRASQGADQAAARVPVRRPLSEEAGGARHITIRFLPETLESRSRPDTNASPARPPHPTQAIEEAEALAPESDAQPREVEVRFLEAQRAGRVFPCLQRNVYSGCIGYEQCKVLCWSPRLRERQALVRVDKPTGGPCRDCTYAREVLGEVATLSGRQVRLIECRLGFWYGRTTVGDFVDGKIALNVQLPCPGFVETDTPHPAVAHMREVARRRMRHQQREQKAGRAKRGMEHNISK